MDKQGIKEMQFTGRNFTIIGVIILVVNVFVEGLRDEPVLTIGGCVMLFMGIDLLIKSNKLKKRR